MISIGIQARRAVAGPVDAWWVTAGVMEHVGCAAGCGRYGRLTIDFLYK